MSITGTGSGEPQKVGVALVDVLAGLFATIGILAAVRHRERTGEGQRVDVDLLSSLLTALVNQASAYTIASVTTPASATPTPASPPTSCSKPPAEISSGSRQRPPIRHPLRRIGAPDLAHDPRYATNPERVRHRDHLRAELEQPLARHPAAHWVRELTAARVPAGVVNDIAEAFALAASLGLNPIVELPRGDGDTVRLPRNPINLSATPPTYRTTPPALPTHEPALPPGAQPAALTIRARRPQRGRTAAQ